MKKLITYLIPLVIFGSFVFISTPAEASKKTKECKNLKNKESKLRTEIKSLPKLITNAQKSLVKKEKRRDRFKKEFESARAELKRLKLIAKIFSSPLQRKIKQVEKRMKKNRNKYLEEKSSANAQARLKKALANQLLEKKLALSANVLQQKAKRCNKR